MNMLSDQVARKRALDTSASFIVQAPAGSGKTELLTQRYLGLLSQVNQAPEEIKALTFTRKAAAEMRSRIIAALQRGLDDSPPETTHGRTTWELARQALARDQELDWQLINNPNRLCVQTIDALCAGIASQAPILSQLGGQPEIAEDARSLYQEAAESFIQGLDEDRPWQAALSGLLMHLDNNTAWLSSLFVSMLGKRDQWLPQILQQQDSTQLRIILENSLKIITQEALDNCVTCFDSLLIDELMTLIQFSENYRQQRFDFDIFPGSEINSLDAWQKIARLLLTTKFTWRKSITKNQGFPAASIARNEQEKVLITSMKQRIKSLLSDLQDNEALRTALQMILLCPPIAYAESQWHMVKTLISLLPYLAAQLRLVFQQHNCVDFIEIANSALTALGNTNQPTQQALNLDYKIQHLLIDEFQDTSISQFHLLQQLTGGWQTDDGRTLFLVGDPMQSIYRFRQAEVGLFIHARQHGIGDIQLESLQLRSNFRSEKSLVGWFNTTFANVFPQIENISDGAVSYADADPTQPDTQKQAVFSYALDKKQSSQAIKVSELIKQYTTQSPHDSIAILVRSRSHLRDIIAQLKQAEIQFQAVNLENLSEHSVIYDLMVLTKALCHPADRLSWLAVLRAPWCGLSLIDLHRIATFNKETCIWQNIQSLFTENTVSPANTTTVTPANTTTVSPANTTTVSPANTTTVTPAKAGVQDNTWIPAYAGMTTGVPSGMTTGVPSEMTAEVTTKLPAKMTPPEQLTRIIPIFENALSSRCKSSLRELIESTWLALGGPACITDEVDLDYAHSFFDLLEQHETAGLITDFKLFKQQVMRLFANSSISTDCNVYVMTMHKAKGLEFDHVILPSLDKRPARDKNPLLFTAERTNHLGQTDLIMAPIKASTENNEPIYSYLQSLEAQKQHYESMRLLYVAATRAKKTLHLFADIETAASQSLFSLLPEQCHQQFNPVRTNEEIFVEEDDHSLPTIQRLKSTWKSPYIPEQKAVSFNDNMPIAPENSDDSPRIIGIVIHEFLQQLSVSIKTDHINDNVIEVALRQHGILPQYIHNAIKQVNVSLANTLNDSRGRWILSDQHQEAHSEFPITAIIDGEIKHLVIDRTFIDDNDTRWIIDYKTALPADGQKLDDFLQQQCEQYKGQLATYAQAIAMTEKRTVQLGLYFPSIAAWICLDNMLSKASLSMDIL